MSLEAHISDCMLGELSLVEALLYQPMGIWAMNILCGTLVLRRIPCCCVYCGRNLMFLPGETLFERGRCKKNPHGLWSRPLPVKNKPKHGIVWNGSMWQKHLQSWCWKCLRCWVYMANRIQTSEQRNGFLSRLDITDEMLAGSMCTPAKGCRTGWRQHSQLQHWWELGWGAGHLVRLPIVF